MYLHNAYVEQIYVFQSFFLGTYAAQCRCLTLGQVVLSRCPRAKVDLVPLSVIPPEDVHGEEQMNVGIQGPISFSS